MGVVYKANQLALGRMVAMKVLPQHLTKDQSFIRRFENEARAIAKLNHPNIVQIYDIGHEDDFYFYTMEYVEGPSLDDILYKEGVLSLGRSVNIVLQVAKALQYAHSRGIVHRDIKPSNIMVDKAGRIRVTDFGLALQERTTRLTVEGSIVGTPEYMSPEQAAGEVATSRSDIYSLGVVFYEMLTGKIPFEGDSTLMVLKKIQTTEPVWPRSLNPGISEETDTVVRRMMAKNPGNRYASCQELLDDIRRIKSGGSIPRKRRTPSLTRLMLAGLPMVLILSLVLGLKAYQGTRQSAPIDTPVSERTDDKRAVEKQPDVESPSPPAAPPNAVPAQPSPQENGAAQRERELATLEEAFRDIRARKTFPREMWPDLLLLSKGSEINCEVIAESIDKVRIRTEQGLAEIPRNEIELMVYATPAEEKAAEKVRVDEEKRLQKEREIRSRIQELVESEEPVEETGGSETRPQGEQIAGVQKEREALAKGEAGPSEPFFIPLFEGHWHVKSTCEGLAKVSFDDNILSIPVGQRADKASCSIIVETSNVSGLPASIELLVEMKQLVVPLNGKVVCSFLVTLTNGKSIEYCLYDEQPGVLTTEEETPAEIAIRRPQTSIVAGSGWHVLTLPIAEDAATIGEGAGISSIAFVGKQIGKNCGRYLLRCKGIAINPT